jgi:hypothetical protein
LSFIVRLTRRFAALLPLVLAARLVAIVGRAFAADKIGVVLMHGEQGASGRVIDDLATALEKAGYLVSGASGRAVSYRVIIQMCLASGRRSVLLS